MDLAVAIKNRFSYAPKFAHSSQFRDGLRPTLIDVDVAEFNAMLAEDFDEVAPETLSTLPHGARLIYIKHDGRPIIGVVIVRHSMVESGVGRARCTQPKTLVTYPPSGVVTVSAAAVRAGRMKMPTRGAFTWYIAESDINRLFVCRSVALADRLAASEAKVEALMSAADEAKKVIEGLMARIVELEAHSTSQRAVLEKVVRRITAAPTPLPPTSETMALSVGHEISGA